ncbi:hypothetical protein PROFUN_16190 [Planoprotostelium fungivorum]|uniref:Uncharacterized protein n=1 Tax=Planoprotostelium fungivorum TaxID=1890364 RepID=A0A2P6MS02_9EUKA|nr:hypothetical protein PROFUN_16190 [Planoprotostelium fungivorum]
MIVIRAFNKRFGQLGSELRSKHLIKRNLREISATKKHIQCTFIEKELLGFFWFEIILYKQRLIELFGSYVVTIHHRGMHFLHKILLLILVSGLFSFGLRTSESSYCSTHFETPQEAYAMPHTLE